MDKFQKTLLTVAMGVAVGLTSTASMARDGMVEATVIGTVAPSLSFMVLNGGSNGVAGLGALPGEAEPGAGEISGQPGEVDNANPDASASVANDPDANDVSGGVERIASPFMYLEERTATLSWDLKSSTQEFYLECDAFDLYKGGNVAGQWKIDAIRAELFSTFANPIPIPSEPSGFGDITDDLGNKIGTSSGVVLFSGDTPDPNQLMGPTGCVVTYKQLNPKLPAGEYWGKVKLTALTFFSSGS